MEWKEAGEQGMKQIDVIIPTYNRAEYILAAIQSVLEQAGDGQSFEITAIWVIDDGSTDDTESIVKSIQDQRIHYHKQENRGASHARNVGASLAGAEWIAFQDSDDIWNANKLEKQVAYLEKHTDCQMVTHAIRAIFDAKNAVYTVITDADDQVKILAVRNFADTPTMLIKRDVFLACGGFDESLKALEDWEFALRYADKGHIGVVPEALLDAYMTTTGVSSNVGNYFESRCKMIAKNRRIFLKHDCLAQTVQSLLEFAREEGVLEKVARMLELYMRKTEDLQ